MPYEKGRKRMLLMQGVQHFSLFNPSHDAKSNCGCCCRAHTLARQASLAKKAPGPQQCDDSFLAVTRQHRKLHGPSLNVKDRLSRVPLDKEGLSATVRQSRAG